MKRILLGFIFSLLAFGASAQGLPVCNNGDMIYRGSVGYQCVPYDNTAGKFLRTNGAGGAPSWTFQAPQQFLLPTQSTNTFLGNTTGSNASPTPNTVSNILDTIGYDIARPPGVGSLLYKSAVAPNNAWQALAPAPSATGWLLTSGGVANPPYWSFSTSAASPGVAGTCLESNGVSAAPTYQGCNNATNTAVTAPITATFGTPQTTFACPTCVTSSGGGAVTGTLPIAVSAASDVSCSTCVTPTLNTAALTKVDDTNVTLTLGGAPTTALVNAASITAGWAGTLAYARGGTNAATQTDARNNIFPTASAAGDLAYWNGTAWTIFAGNASGTKCYGENASGVPSWLACNTSAATVTSVSFTGGLISVATATTTPALTVAGTSGGIPYFSSASTWASSAALAANALVVGGGAGATPATVTTGSGILAALATNTGSAGAPSIIIAKGTSAMGTGAISSATCATVVTTTATGTATTDVVNASFNGDPTAVTGYVPLTTGMLTIVPYPSANNVNFKVCNNTGASITPGAITLNWIVVR